MGSKVAARARTPKRRTRARLPTARDETHGMGGFRRTRSARHPARDEIAT